MFSFNTHRHGEITPTALLGLDAHAKPAAASDVLIRTGRENITGIGLEISALLLRICLDFTKRCSIIPKNIIDCSFWETAVRPNPGHTFSS